ncbi:MAG: hypothetical protein R3B51_11970 [Thermodesulfobacteriota bacterium]
MTKSFMAERFIFLFLPKMSADSGGDEEENGKYDVYYFDCPVAHVIQAINFRGEENREESFRDWKTI